MSRFSTATEENYIAAISSHLENAGFSTEEIAEFIAEHVDYKSASSLCIE